MSEAIFIIPGDIETATGGYGYDHRLIELMPSMGVTARHVALSGNFPIPSREDVEQALQALADAPATAKLIIDELALGALPADRMSAFSDRIIALVHHPLAQDTGLSEAQRGAFIDGERAVLQLAHHVIATSRSAAHALVEDFGVEKRKITIAEPGTDPAQRATGTGTPLQLLAVGSILKRRGYDVLVEALRPLKSYDWRLTIVGALDREPETTEDLRQRISAVDFDERIALSGVVVPATQARLYESTDIFVLASLFEGYGMALGDAMARGLPIVCTMSGAAAESVPEAAAIKVRPGDGRELSAALQALLSDKKLREKLADASWEAGRDLPPWNETARRVAAVILDIAH